MIVRIKELWQVRTAIERILAGDLDSAHSDILAGPVGEAIWLAYITYKLERDRKTAEFGLNRPGDMKAEDRKDREKLFNDWADEASQEEVTVPDTPVSIHDLPGFKIKPVDLMMLRTIGLFSNGR